MATLKDIADAAGVSMMTVSNVINGNYKKVSAKKKKLILDLIEEYQYVPNLSARSLTSKSSKIIGIILSSGNPQENFFTNPYTSELFGEIETLLREKGYYIIVSTSQNIDDASTLSKNWNVDGVIFLTHQDSSSMQKILSNSKCPMVFIDSNDPSASALTIGIDDFKGGYTATKYLIHRGHKKIAFAGYYSDDNAIIFQRHQGYLAALKEAGIPYSAQLLINTFTRYEDGIIIGRDIANNKYDITAVFTTADILAVGIIEGAKLNGCIVPNDLSVVGFDNLKLCSYVTPKLTTISQNVHQKASAAVDLLMDAIDDESIRNKAVILDVQLEERQSVLHV